MANGILRSLLSLEHLVPWRHYNLEYFQSTFAKTMYALATPLLYEDVDIHCLHYDSPMPNKGYLFMRSILEKPELGQFVQNLTFNFERHPKLEVDPFYRYLTTKKLKGITLAETPPYFNPGWNRQRQPRMVYPVLSLAIGDQSEVLDLTGRGCFGGSLCDGLPGNLYPGGIHADLEELEYLKVDRPNLCARCFGGFFENCCRQIKSLEVVLNRREDDAATGPTTDDVLESLGNTSTHLEVLDIHTSLSQRPESIQIVDDHPDVPIDDLITSVARRFNFLDDEASNIAGFTNLRRLAFDYEEISHGPEQLVRLLWALSNLQQRKLWSRRVLRLQLRPAQSSPDAEESGTEVDKECIFRIEFEKAPDQFETDSVPDYYWQPQKPDIDNDNVKRMVQDGMAVDIWKRRLHKGHWKWIRDIA
ncbi:hypothetical protein QBC35DRAFT_477479 [Podospora australis]|uniref:Uncharacterized protein n=1 Tax=Podospora australis TaxID=1536484 RepID=A0AAN6WLW2_9PEZI|nr:hypothetical protein QBC35DRAFT_477479 [Podospora australis]